MAAGLSYREYAPDPELRAHVRCLWEMRGPCDEPTSQLIVPDGCTGLVLNFGGPLEQVVDESAVSRPDALFIGEVRRPFSMRSRGQTELLGVSFWPGAARCFVDATPGEVVDRMADATLLRASLAREIARTAQSAEPAERSALLQQALRRELDPRNGPGALVRAALRELWRDDGGVAIEDLAARLGVSRRHLERQFVADVGVAPKSLAGVLRFRRLLRALDEAPSPGWSGVAADHGYYDQSHLIRDFKRFTGRSPGRYLRERARPAAP